jgi:DinB family protein
MEATMATTRARSPDPVREAAAYQAHLLGLLGADDPAAVQEATPGTLRELVAEAGDALRTRPEPAEWSVLECAGHIADAEIVYAGRYRWILAHDEPPLIGYDQDRWVGALRHRDADPKELLAMFEPLRAANIALWRRSSAGDRARIGRHEERGAESLDLSFRLIAGHDRFHLGQARRTLDALRPSGAGRPGDLGAEGR